MAAMNETNPDKDYLVTWKPEITATKSDQPASKVLDGAR
jgi:hypothetical protein